MVLTPIRQPEGSSLCGQCCVAMAAGVSLDRAVEIVGHKRGTYTREVRDALRSLGVPCGDRCLPLSRSRPVLPRRGLLALHRPPGSKKPEYWHWLLAWDGQVHDPAGVWPDYDGWKITSYLPVSTSALKTVS